LPEFFIKFLTEPGDLVVDPFAGSNVTGEVAERLERHWLAFEIVEEYLEAKFRFLGLYEQPFLFTMRAEALETETVGNVEAVSQPQLLEPGARYEADHKEKE
jgi:hypothetical protein